MRTTETGGSETTGLRTPNIEAWILLFVLPALIFIGGLIYAWIVLTRPGYPVNLVAKFNLDVREQKFVEACSELVAFRLFDSLPCGTGEPNWIQLISLANARPEGGVGFVYDLDREHGMSVSLYGNHEAEVIATAEDFYYFLSSADHFGGESTMSHERTGTVVGPTEMPSWFQEQGQ